MFGRVVSFRDAHIAPSWDMVSPPSSSSCSSPSTLPPWPSPSPSAQGARVGGNRGKRLRIDLRKASDMGGGQSTEHFLAGG
jgi:hypothetical protein